ncbi:site-specific tyrosine recombinase XerD, partial [Lactobacillus sp. XV13L]|nr:site-specific tyrosine recombinase XerD [Lactobacillus sp. XV13L]
MSNLRRDVEDYLRYSQIERGLSNNTIAAYRQDLTTFLAFLKEEGINSWPTKAVDIDAFLA